LCCTRSSLHGNCLPSHHFSAEPTESLCHQTSWNKAPDKEEGGKSAPAEKEVAAGAWVDGVVLV